MPVFYAFDCLWHNGHDLRWHTLIERNNVLKCLLRNGPDRLRYVGSSPARMDTPSSMRALRTIWRAWSPNGEKSTNLQADHETAWLKVKNWSYTGAEGMSCSSRKRRYSKESYFSRWPPSHPPYAQISAHEF